MVAIKKGSTYVETSVAIKTPLGLSVRECTRYFYDDAIQKYICIFNDYVGGRPYGRTIEYLDTLELPGYDLYKEESPFIPDLAKGDILYSRPHKQDIEIVEVYLNSTYKGDKEVLVKFLTGNYPYQILTEQYIRANMELKK